MILKQVHLNRDGLDMFFGGKIETAIMITLWELDKGVSVSELYHAMHNAGYPWAYNTVATVITRLLEKQMLKRRKAIIRPVIASEDDFIDQCILTIVTKLTEQYPTSFKEAICND